MKKTLIIFALIYCDMCFAQSFSSVKVYIANPYVDRVDVIKTQMYNTDYVRSHYATYIFSMEKKYIKNLYDSLMSVPLERVAHDSVGIIIPHGINGEPDIYFEPCIVIDFIRGDRYNTNEDVWTFSMNKQGYVCRTFHSEGYLLCYPSQRLSDFLMRRFIGMFFLVEKDARR